MALQFDILVFGLKGEPPGDLLRNGGDIETFAPQRNRGKLAAREVEQVVRQLCHSVAFLNNRSQEHALLGFERSLFAHQQLRRERQRGERSPQLVRQSRTPDESS